MHALNGWPIGGYWQLSQGWNAQKKKKDKTWTSATAKPWCYVHCNSRSCGRFEYLCRIEGIACEACNAKWSVNVLDAALHVGANVPHRLSDDWHRQDGDTVADRIDQDRQLEPGQQQASMPKGAKDEQDTADVTSPEHLV